MSRDDNVLTELLEAFGISGNLFILWDENGTLITCDQQTRIFLESNGTQKFENIDIDKTDYYFSNAIARSSKTMSDCKAARESNSKS